MLDPHDRLFAPHIRGILTELVDQVKHLVERSRGMPFEREGRFVVHLAQMALKSCP